MATNSYTREAIRVKVKKCEPNMKKEWKKFSVDPQITTLDVLYSIVAKAFDIKSDFSIKYKAFDPAGNEIYLAVLSDWDLDAAFLRIHNLSIQTATEPCLILQIDIKPFTEVKDWDAVAMSAGGSTITAGAREILVTPIQQSIGMSQKYVQNMQTKLPGLIINQMEKTFSIVQKAFNLSEETMTTLPPRPPLSDNEFRLYLDSLGKVQRNDELRKVIFLGGIEPSLRRVVWKHILNVYPNGMSGRQRMDYMKRKSDHYHKLRNTWKTAIRQGCLADELSYVTSMVKKDVLRTDRLHPFYAGNDDNQNIASLFNILTTYALNHPSVSYCQGMSDIASPILVTMNDEAQAYICFCAVMMRLKMNFMLDGIAMTKKFAHLTEALSFYDPIFFEYLKSQQADDLLFCYRWLLLELKREFPFEDALRMLEVQWSSLNYDKLDSELPLFEKEFEPTMMGGDVSDKTSIPPISPVGLLAMTKSRESPYAKVCALRRQSSSSSLSSLSSSIVTTSDGLNHFPSILNHKKLDTIKRFNHSLDDSITRRLRKNNISRKAHQSLDETKIQMLIDDMENSSSNIDQSESIASPKDSEFESENGTSDYFVFHPTNPFIEEALCKSKTQQNAPKLSQLNPTSTIKTNNEDKCSTISNVFLSSDDGGSSCTSSVDDLTSSARKKLNKFPKAIMKLHNKNVLTNYSAVSNIIVKQMSDIGGSGSCDENNKKSGGGHFKDLKEKIVANSRKVMLSKDKSLLPDIENNEQKLVKNFNEFLNFASLNKNRISNKRDINKQFTLPSNSSPSHTTEHDSAFDEIDSSTTVAPTQLESLSSSGMIDKSEINGENVQEENDESVIGAIEQATNLNLTQEDCQYQEYYSITTAMTRELRMELENLDRQVFGECSEEAGDTSEPQRISEIEYEKLGKDSMDLIEDLKEDEIITCPDVNELIIRRKERDKKLHNSENDALKTTDDVLSWDTSTQKDSSNHDLGFDSNDIPNGNDSIDEQQIESVMESSIESLNPFIVDVFGEGVEISNETTDHLTVEEATTSATTTTIIEDMNFGKSRSSSGSLLPPPNEFGGGNPFLMFLCLTLLLQHRNIIMKSNMDYNEIAMHFDKMVRKHDVTRVLNQARRMYVDYLKMYKTVSSGRNSTELRTQQQ